MKKEELAGMKVAELKQEARNRGLKLEHKGHKFNKGELIENILEYDKQFQEETKPEPVKQETEENAEPVKVTKENKEYIKFATTAEEIDLRYGGKKNNAIFDDLLKVGCIVVFWHYVEAKDGNIYKKLRTAKVLRINRAKKVVVVELFLGDQKQLNFEDLLYIRSLKEGSRLPKDLGLFLRNQRTKKGAEQIEERFKAASK